MSGAQADMNPLKMMGSKDSMAILSAVSSTLLLLFLHSSLLLRVECTTMI
jgi:hypothetical protein